MVGRRGGNGGSSACTYSRAWQCSAAPSSHPGTTKTLSAAPPENSAWHPRNISAASPQENSVWHHHKVSHQRHVVAGPGVRGQPCAQTLQRGRHQHRQRLQAPAASAWWRWRPGGSASGRGRGDSLRFCTGAASAVATAAAAAANAAATVWGEPDVIHSADEPVA